MKDKETEDYSKPAAEINYDSKKRGKRRRGEEVDAPKRSGRLEPYKRESFKLQVEEEVDLSKEFYCISLERFIDINEEHSFCYTCTDWYDYDYE